MPKRSFPVLCYFDGERRLVGIEIDNASKVVNLSRVETEALPVIKVA